MPAVSVIHFDGILVVCAPGVARAARAMHEADVVPLLGLFERVVLRLRRPFRALFRRRLLRAIICFTFLNWMFVSTFVN